MGLTSSIFAVDLDEQESRTIGKRTAPAKTAAFRR
jgi:hypothetical protein